MGKLLIFFLLVSAFAGTILFNYKQYVFYNEIYAEAGMAITPEEIRLTAKPPYTAKVLIFTNSIRRDFTAPSYHKLSEEAFIESSSFPNTVNVNEEVTWQEFFNTMPAPFKITHDCLTTGMAQTLCNKDDIHTLKFYLNGQLEPEVLSQVIRKNDKLLITFGADSQETIDSQLKLLNTLK